MYFWLPKIGCVMKISNNIFNIKWQLVLYDLLAFFVTDATLLFIYKNFLSLGWKDIIANSVLALGSILVARLFGNVYKQIWRYGGIQCYIRLLVTDTVATIIFISLEYIFDALTPFKRLTFALMVALMSVDLLLALAMRMTYRYCFKCGNEVSLKGKVLRFLLKRFAGITVKKTDDSSKIKIAIVGAGKTGVSLAEELLDNVNSPYLPRLFIDINDEKIGREIHDIPVISKNESISEIIKKYKIQEIVIAISSATAERKKNFMISINNSDVR